MKNFFQSTKIKEAQGFIFDMDGTVINSHYAHYRAWDKVTRAHGLQFKKKEITRHFGKTTPSIARALFSEKDDRFIKQISEEKAGYFLQEIPEIQIIEGSEEVFERLHERGKNICLASSNIKKAIHKVVETFTWEGLIDAIVGLDEIKNGKPDPEMMEISARKLRLETSECIVIGDSIYDIQSGIAAGSKLTVGVLTGIFSKEKLLAAGANLVLETAGSLLEWL